MAKCNQLTSLPFKGSKHYDSKTKIRNKDVCKVKGTVCISDKVVCNVRLRLFESLWRRQDDNTHQQKAAEGCMDNYWTSQETAAKRDR